MVHLYKDGLFNPTDYRFNTMKRAQRQMMLDTNRNRNYHFVQGPWHDQRDK
jgi:argonaute-like protein implicated in RNA metabolism and viral defense